MELLWGLHRRHASFHGASLHWGGARRALCEVSLKYVFWGYVFLLCRGAKKDRSDWVKSRLTKEGDSAISRAPQFGRLLPGGFSTVQMGI